MSEEKSALGDANDYETFESRRKATDKVKALLGWPKARVTQINIVDDANPQGAMLKAWVIEAASGQFLRTDGYVR